MINQKNSTVAIVMGQKEKQDFNRYSFPIVGRPVAQYPIMAATNSKKIEAVYLSSDAEDLLEIGKHNPGVELLIRETSFPTLTEEVRNALNIVIHRSKNTPTFVVLLLANSPCITSAMIDLAIERIERDPELTSVVSAMRRDEFRPERLLSKNKNDELVRHFANDFAEQEFYFLDRRLMVIRTETVLASLQNSQVFETLLGNRISPIMQQEGIWDIDYIWQVPIADRWLRENGFGEDKTPYQNRSAQTDSLSKSSSKTSSEKFRVLVTTVPFGAITKEPVQYLVEHPNIEFVINPIGRKLTEEESIQMVRDFDILIAGTEMNSRAVLENAPRLKLIARVGIGLDSVDLTACRELGVQVSYTPDAPAPAVAELTMAHMINLLRRVPFVDRKMRAGIWQRYSGERLHNLTIGVIGTGRVGKRVIDHLQGFHPQNIFVHDIHPDESFYEMFGARHVSLNELLEQSDLITVHVPLTPATKNMIGSKEFSKMKQTAYLINTARGGIVNEHDLYDALHDFKIAGAAMDVFEKEPYAGSLLELDNCLFSCHMGSMTSDCRSRMEIEATQDVIRFVNGEPLKQPVPEAEYHYQK